MNEFSIFCSGPPSSYGEVNDWRKYMVNNLPGEIKILFPLELCYRLECKENKNNFRQSYLSEFLRVIIYHDRMNVMRSNIIIANFFRNKRNLG